MTPAESIRAQMQQLRCEIDEDVEGMAVSARNKVDWRHYVRTYPWVCLGSAIALGFLIVPRRSTAIRADLASRTELARTGRPAVAPGPAVLRGVVDGLLTAAANIAVRKATACLVQSVGRLLGNTEGMDKPS
jgi:hypothetical protein